MITSVPELLGEIVKSGHRNPDGQVVAWVCWTPELAYRVLTEIMYNRQRDIRPRNLQALMAALDNDTFLNNNVIWLDQTPTGEVIAINGQHTLESVFQTKKPAYLMTVLSPVASLVVVMRHYGLFDAGAARTQMEINRAIDAEIDFNAGTGRKPWMATDWHISKGTAAASWLLKGLRTNTVGPAVGNIQKFETIFHEDKWRPEFVKFWQALGPLEDDSLGPNQRAVWKAFYLDRTGKGGLTSASYMPVMMARLRSHPDQTIGLIKELVVRAKAAHTIPKGSRDGVDQLYNFVFEPDAQFRRMYGHGRKELVRRFALHVRYAMEGEIDINRIDRQKTQSKETTWDILTEGMIPIPDYDTSRTKPDLAAARRRRLEIPRGASQQSLH